MANFFKCLESAKKDASSSNSASTMALLYKVMVFVEGGSYSRSRDYQRYYRCIGLPVKEAAQILGIREDSYRKVVSSLSKSLFSLFGENFFDLLASGEVEYCELVVDEVIGESKLVDLVSSDITSLVESLASGRDKEFASGDHKAGTFVEEVNFLADISNPLLKARMSNLDIGKLLYLCKLLEGEVGSISDRVNLSNYILERAGEVL